MKPYNKQIFNLMIVGKPYDIKDIMTLGARD